MRALPSRKLDRRMTRVWRLTAAIQVVIWMGITMASVGLPAWFLRSSASAGDRTAAAVLGWITLGLAIATVVLLVLCVVVAPKIMWIQWSFDVLDEEIDIHKGIFWRKRLIIPLIRVQNVETRQGPIMRAHGLASLTVATAAGEHEIPGLAVDEAEALRDHVAVLARIAQEDV